MNDIEHLVKVLKKEVTQGITKDDAIIFLHDNGLTITDSIKVFMQVYGCGLGEAKKSVADHKVWAAIVRSAKPLHNDLSSPSYFDALKK